MSQLPNTQYPNTPFVPVNPAGVDANTSFQNLVGVESAIADRQQQAALQAQQIDAQNRLQAQQIDAQNRLQQQEIAAQQEALQQEIAAQQEAQQSEQEFAAQQAEANRAFSEQQDAARFQREKELVDLELSNTLAVKKFNQEIEQTERLAEEAARTDQFDEFRKLNKEIYSLEQQRKQFEEIIAGQALLSASLDENMTPETLIKLATGTVDHAEAMTTWATALATYFSSQGTGSGGSNIAEQVENQLADEGSAPLLQTASRGFLDWVGDVTGIDTSGVENIYLALGLGPISPTVSLPGLGLLSSSNIPGLEPITTVSVGAKDIRSERVMDAANRRAKEMFATGEYESMEQARDAAMNALTSEIQNQNAAYAQMLEMPEELQALLGVDEKVAAMISNFIRASAQGADRQQLAGMLDQLDSASPNAREGLSVAMTAVQKLLYQADRSVQNASDLTDADMSEEGRKSAATLRLGNTQARKPLEQFLGALRRAGIKPASMTDGLPGPMARAFSKGIEITSGLSETTQRTLAFAAREDRLHEVAAELPEFRKFMTEHGDAAKQYLDLMERRVFDRLEDRANMRAFYDSEDPFDMVLDQRERLTEQLGLLQQDRDLLRETPLNIGRIEYPDFNPPE